jgi:hypothetical protein
MAEQIWGFGGGLIAGQEYLQAQQMHGLVMQEGQQKLQEGTLSIQEKELAIKQSKNLVEQQQKMLHFMDTLDAKGQPNPTDMAQAQAEKLMQVADAQMHSGMFEESRKTSETATLMMKQNADMADRKSNTELKKLKDVTDLLGGAQDARGWDQAKQMFPVLHPDEAKDPNVQKLLQMPYSPQLVQTLQSTIQTAKDKAETDRAKAGTRAADAETAERNFRTKVLLPKEAEAEALRVEKLKQAGGESLVPTKDDVNEIVNRVQDEFGAGKTGVSKPTAETVASRIAPQVAAYRKQGLSPGAAADKAYKDAKDRGELKDLAKPSLGADVAVRTIDELIGMLDSAEAQGKDVTGLSGAGRRLVKETVGEKLGMTDDTTAKDFEAKLEYLKTGLSQQSLMNTGKAGGYFSKLKLQELSKIARGTSMGDTMSSSRSSLIQLREQLTGQKAKPPEATNVMRFDSQGNPIP